MKIYIASSWKNQHAVEMLTAILRENRGHEVVSFVENEQGKQSGHLPTDDLGAPLDFDDWVNSARGRRCFVYDTDGATKSDLVIYIGPSGIDAWAEVGAAWASGVPIIGLHAKGEASGLMRRMMLIWCKKFSEVLSVVDTMHDAGTRLLAEHQPCG